MTFWPCRTFSASGLGRKVNSVQHLIKAWTVHKKILWFNYRQNTLDNNRYLPCTYCYIQPLWHPIFLFVGADDIQQLKELNDSEFKQLCVMVGMATKPFHVMRFQKSLQRHSHLTQITPVSVLQVGMAATTGPHPSSLISGTHVQQSPARSVTSVGTILSPLHLASQHPTTSSTPLQFPSHVQLPSVGGNLASATFDSSQQIGSSGSQQCIAGVTGPQSKYLNAVNVHSEPHSMMPQSESDRKLFLPPYLQPSSDCRSFDDLIDDLTPVQKTLGPCPFSPNIWDPQRAELIRKYAAIYGQNASKRKNGQLNAFEENVNEAANQLCLRDPTLLVRREELFTLARRALKEGGYAFYHGFSNAKECKNSLVTAVPQKRQLDNREGEEQHTKEPYQPLTERKKRRTDRITALEILIATNKSEQSVKLAALEKAQQSNDFSTAYHIQMEIESLGNRCMTLQTEYSSLKKKHRRSERYYKSKQQLKVVPSQGSQAVRACTSNDDINSSSSDEHLVAATTNPAHLTHHTDTSSPPMCTQSRPSDSRNFLSSIYHENSLEFERSVPAHAQHLPPHTPPIVQPVPFYRSPVTAQFLCNRNPQPEADHEAEELVATVTQCASEVSRLLMKFDNTHSVNSSLSSTSNTQTEGTSTYSTSSLARKLWYFLLHNYFYEMILQWLNTVFHDCLNLTLLRMCTGVNDLWNVSEVPGAWTHIQPLIVPMQTVIYFLVCLLVCCYCGLTVWLQTLPFMFSHLWVCNLMQADQLIK